VVAPEQEDLVRVKHLKQQQEEEGLQGLVAAVDEVAYENVLGLSIGPAVLGDVENVEELAVNVAT